MKCPHCGMNLRDDITECGYCGGKIAQKKERAAAGAAKFTAPRASPGHSAAAPARKTSGDVGAEEEEEGGISSILQPGEQVLIASLNVSVKKFSFHAYLTNQRIFLIDTQEKKIKVTAKDVPRDTIAGSIVEFSETSDPVLVLSLRSEEDEVKTMKLVFVQSGTDRSAEMDEWISLLQGEEPAPAKKAQKRPAAAPVREPEQEEEPEEEAPVRKPVRRPAAPLSRVQEPISEEEEAEEEVEEGPPIRVPERARPRPEMQPARRPVKKDHERQPPVKRPISMYKAPEEESVPEDEPAPATPAPPRRVPVKQVIATSYEREIPPARKEEEPPVERPAVQSAMKVAMQSAIRQTGPVSQRSVRRTVIEPVPVPVTEEEPAPVIPSRRPVVQESRQVAVPEKPAPDEMKEATPQFCHNCGKKLPHSANFCPGCGTKLNAGRTLPHSKTSPALAKKMTRTDPPGHEHRPVPPPDEEEAEEEKPVPTRPPVRKAPKGSEMTILHKFLRR